MTKKISLILSKSNLKNYSWKSKYYWINKENLALNIFEEINIQKYLTRIFQIYGLMIHNCKINISKFKLEIYISYYITLKSIKLINRKTFSTNLFNKRHSNVSSKNFLFKKSFKENKKTRFKSFVANNKIGGLSNLNSDTTNIMNTFLEKLLESFFIFKVSSPKISIVFNNINRGFSMAPFTFKNILVLKKILMQLRMYKNNKYFNAREFVNVLLIVIRKKDSAKFLSEYLAHQMRYMKRHYVLLGFLKRALHLFISSQLSKIKGVKIVIKGRLNGKLRKNIAHITVGAIPIQTLAVPISYNNAISYTPYGTFGIKVWVAEY